MRKILLMVGTFLLVSIGFSVYAATVEYSTTSTTSGNVIATLTGLATGDVITNNGGLSTYPFTSNGTFTFEYSGATTTGSATATVTNIDKTVTGAISYSPSTSTSGHVTGTITFVESGVTIANNSGSDTYLFTGNGSFTFNFQDTLGNVGSTTATVTWITGAINTGTTNTGTTNTGTVSTGTTTTTTTTTGTQDITLQTGTVLTDSCPLGDKSGDTKDGKCYATRTGNITSSKYSTETNNAYLFAYSKGITDATTIKNASVTSLITRKQFAKMATLFAMNVLHKTPDNSLTCAFTDMKRETAEMKNSAILVCKLKIMGIDKSGLPNTKFNPNGNLTRAQLGTILSRLLRGSTHDLNTTDYYKDHLAALKTAGIMNNTTDATIKEKRGNIMIMLMRAANQ